MRKLTLLLLSVLSALFAYSQDTSLAIIPQPVSEQLTGGHFVLPPSIVVETLNQKPLAHTLQDLKTHLSVPTGYSVTVTSQPSPAATIRLVLNKTVDNTLGAEGYNLSVTSRAVVIRANQPAGLFYGVQTLYQLLPKEIGSPVPVKNVVWKAPCVTITDYPRFGWRGFMLDVARHFSTKQEVKGFIDEMVQYKFNLLHLHLTDDEGWRIQIKSLPKLTTVGAWNVRRQGTFGTFAAPAADEPKDYGGYYTQDDIREIV